MNDLITFTDPGVPHHHDHQRVAERAYGFWQEEGRPEGRALEHWYRAEREEQARRDKPRPGEPQLAA